jgi:hypothetical protein
MISHTLRLTLNALRMIWSAPRSSALSKSSSAHMESLSASLESLSAHVESLSAGSESFSALPKSTSALSESFSAHPKSPSGCLWLRSGALVSAVCSGASIPEFSRKAAEHAKNWRDSDVVRGAEVAAAPGQGGWDVGWR